MGTRGLIGFIFKGQRRACYNHFDSYHEGLGVDVILFILSLTPEEIDLMAKRLEQIVWMQGDETPSQELHKLYIEREYHMDDHDKDPLYGFYKIYPYGEDGVDQYMEALKRWEDEKVTRERRALDWTHDWINLLRGVRGARSLRPIFEGKLEVLPDQSYFEEDGLFCEYTYWIDFESRQFSTSSSDFFQQQESQEHMWKFEDLAENTYWKPMIERARQMEENIRAGRENVHRAVNQRLAGLSGTSSAIEGPKKFA